MPFSGRLPEMFRTENTLRTIAGYNTHENFGRQQYVERFNLLLEPWQLEWLIPVSTSPNWDAMFGPSAKAAMVMWPDLYQSMFHVKQVELGGN
jgi:hypothetical protein